MASSKSEELPPSGCAEKKVETDLDSGKPMSIKDRIRAMNLASNSGSSVPSFGRESQTSVNNPSRGRTLSPNQDISSVSPSPLLAGRSCVTPTNMEYGGFRSLDATRQSNQQKDIVSDPGVGMDTYSAAKAIALWRNKSGRNKNNLNLSDDSNDDDSPEAWNIYDLSSKGRGMEANRKGGKESVVDDFSQDCSFPDKVKSKHDQRAFKNVRNFVPVTPSPTQSSAPKSTFQESSFVMPKLRPVRRLSSTKEGNDRVVQSGDKTIMRELEKPNDKTSLQEKNEQLSPLGIGNPHVNIEKNQLERGLSVALNTCRLQRPSDNKRNQGHHDGKIDAAANKKKGGTPVRSKVSDRIKAFSSPAKGLQTWTQRSVGLSTFSLPCQHHQRCTNKEGIHEEDKSCDSSEKVLSQNTDDDSISVITPGNSTPARLGAQPPTPNSYNSETACSGMSSGDGAVAGSSDSQRRRQQNLYEHFDTPDVSVQDDNSTCASSAGSIMPGTIRKATLLQSKLESDKVKAARRSKKNMKVPCVLVAAQKKAKDSSVSSQWGEQAKGKIQSLDIAHVTKESSLKSVSPKKNNEIKSATAISKASSEFKLSSTGSRKDQSRDESKNSPRIKSFSLTCNNEDHEDISENVKEEEPNQAKVVPEYFSDSYVTSSRTNQIDDKVCQPKEDMCGSVSDHNLGTDESRREIGSNKHLHEKKVNMSNAVTSKGRRSHSSTLQSDAVKKILDRRRRRKANNKSEKAEATSKGDKHDEKENVETKHENIKEDTKPGKLGRGDVRIKSYLEKSARSDLDKTKRQMNKKDEPKLSKDIFTVTLPDEDKLSSNEENETFTLKDKKKQISDNHKLQAPPSIIRSTSRPRGIMSRPTILSAASATIVKAIDSLPLPVCSSSFLSSSDSIEASKDSEFPHDEEPEPSIDHFLEMDLSPIKAVNASKHDFEACTSYRTSPITIENVQRKGILHKQEQLNRKGDGKNDSTPKRMNKNGVKDLDRSVSLQMTESESRSDSDSFVSLALSAPLARQLTDQQRPTNHPHSEVLSSVSMRLRFADKVNSRRKSPKTPDTRNEEEQFKQICDVVSESSCEVRSPSTVSVTSSGVTSLSSRANRVLAGRRGKLKLRKQDSSSKEAILATNLARKMLSGEKSVSRRLQSGNKENIKVNKASDGELQRRPLDLSLDTFAQGIDDSKLADRDDQFSSDDNSSQYLEIIDKSDHSSSGPPSPLSKNDLKSKLSKQKRSSATSLEVKSDSGSWIGNKLSEINMDKLATDIIDGASAAVTRMPLTCSNSSGRDLPFTCGLPDLNSSSISAVRISQLEDEDAPYDEAEVAIEVEYLSNNDLDELTSKNDESELMMRHSFDVGKLPKSNESFFNVSLYKM